MLVTILKEQGPQAASLLGIIMTLLTNLSLNDQSNVKLRLHGAHIVGQILMKTCPALHKSAQYSELPDENIKI